MHQMVELLLRLPHHQYLNKSDNEGFTPLHAAAHRGHGEVAQILIDNNASLDCTSSHGHTPLITASEMGHVACVEALLIAKVESMYKECPMRYCVDAGKCQRCSNRWMLCTLRSS